MNSYEAIGEAGQRTLNALHQIVNNAKNSTETKISNTIQINKDIDNWKQDNLDFKYMSKIFSVTANSNIENYKINLTRKDNKDIGGIKVTDLNNNEKTEFSANEKFKILIPINNMLEEGNFELEVNTKIETKPILYGLSQNSNYQDYALTAATYENGNGNISDKYPKNETEIVIVKQDEETQEKLENVEFQILDKNKNIIYSNLKTNYEGKIYLKNAIPMKYFIQEINTIDGYEKNEELIEIDIKMNEKYVITINNRKEEKPKIEIEKKEIEKETRKLPKTGK